ncbi:MAG: sigma-70 family RNA polymerase sigma factor [Bryobacterales bacterium]|nr:sigma-70 family RNA polymerase sigma factor [Bryobacterales bacterium]
MADTTVSLPVDTTLEHNVPADPVWLVDGLRSGDEAAFEALVLRYQQPVYNLVYRLMDDPSDACDVVQEVFLKVFRNVSGFRGSSSLKTWIYRIAVNEAYNHRRWFHRHRKREIGLEAEEEGSRSYQDVLSDPGRTPFELAAGTETRALVEQALTEVNEVFRPAVILRDMEDMSYEEIAEVLQVSIGTVKSRILRGREALRRMLTGRLEPEQPVRFKPQVVE